MRPRARRLIGVSLAALTAGAAPPGQSTPYAILGRFSVTDTWDGSPLVLAVNESATMPQTPNGSMVLSYQNVATQNNRGELVVTSGGGPPTSLPVEALAGGPSVWANNWRANNLRVTNVSINNDTPIRIQAIGPGIPGSTPLALPVGAPIALAPGQTAQGDTEPRYMQVVVQATSGARSIVAIIGGPADTTGSNVYVVAVNAASTTGPPGSGNPPPPPGYYATTTANTYSQMFAADGGLVFAANLSATVAPPVTVILRAL
ncbi:MAG TPA: hypothetical protein VE913_21495 [Longimicrobium sp.]|nr:hypothetical protein [Longimicrobium sp.]